jgi:hypothetical protein
MSAPAASVIPAGRTVRIPKRVAAACATPENTITDNVSATYATPVCRAE